MLSAVASVFDLALGQMLWSRRSILLALLAGGPVVLAAVIRVLAALTTVGELRMTDAGEGGPAVFGVMIWLLYVRFIVPALGVFYGTSLIADEVDDKTITYLFTRPVPRSAVLIGKYIAYLVCAALLVLPSVVLVYFLVVPMGGGGVGPTFPLLIQDLGLLLVGLAAYGAVFAWVGARLDRPLVVGLVFVFGWEPAVLFLPGYPRWVTIAHYLQALVPHAMPADSAVSMLMPAVRDVPGTGTSLLLLAFTSALALWLAARAVEQREYVLEQ
jgi:hypothetical protein